LWRCPTTSAAQIANRNLQDYDDRPAWFEIMRGLEVLASPPQPPGKFPS
jgi:hypothetical protein